MEIVLIDNTLTRSEAKMLVRSLIMEKLNFHKLRRLSITEGDSGADTAWDDARIQELEQVQKTLSKDIQELPDEFLVDCVIYLDEPLDEDDFEDE